MDLSRPLEVITPTLDGDVLALLAAADTTFTTGQLARMSPHSEAGIRKVLRRLTQQGIVSADRVGLTYAYRLNRDHLAAKHVVGLVNLRQAFLDRIEQSLALWATPPIYAAVFGSAARGSMTVESDVDLLLIRPDDADDDQWTAQVDDLASAMTRWVGNDTRPLEFTAAEVVARGAAEPVLRDVLRDGLTVAGNRAWLAKHTTHGKG